MFIYVLYDVSVLLYVFLFFSFISMGCLYDVLSSVNGSMFVWLMFCVCLGMWEFVLLCCIFVCVV